MVGISVNKEFALDNNIVNETTINFCPIIDDIVIITDNHISNFYDVVREYDLKVISEDEIINLINNN